jgi:hypothetical protein
MTDLLQVDIMTGLLQECHMTDLLRVDIILREITMTDLRLIQEAVNLLPRLMRISTKYMQKNANKVEVL